MVFKVKDSIYNCKNMDKISETLASSNCGAICKIFIFFIKRILYEKLKKKTKKEL